MIRWKRQTIANKVVIKFEHSSLKSFFTLKNSSATTGLEGSGEDMIVVILPDVSLDEVREVHEMLFSTDTQGVLQTVPHHLVVSWHFIVF